VTADPAVPLHLAAAKRRISYVKLRRSQHCDHSVLSSCEKYSITHSELNPLIDVMQALPTHQFNERFADLRATISAFAAKWELDIGATSAEASEDDAEGLDLDLNELRLNADEGEGGGDSGKRTAGVTPRGGSRSVTRQPATAQVGVPPEQVEVEVDDDHAVGAPGWFKPEEMDEHEHDGADEEQAEPERAGEELPEN
jgi:hypothetical protein